MKRQLKIGLLCLLIIPFALAGVSARLIGDLCAYCCHKLVDMVDING